MRRGFTLVELLAVITILSLIALIASISVANLVKNSRDELSSAQIKSIQIAAESWASDNIKDLPTDDNCSFITLKDLKEEGLLDSNLKDLKSKDSIDNEIKIKITSSGKKLDYEVNSKNTNECTYIGSNMYVDLPDGLTPVLYDKKLNSWRVPNINEEWYNYDKQEWANAVVLGKGKSKKPGDVVKVDGTEALMMLVYIPRFEYKIEGEYGTHSDGTAGTQELPGEIEVKFVNTNQTKSDDSYIMHPTFTFGDKELHGIWVGKFELSHKTLSESTIDNNLECSTISCSNADGLRILPDVTSLRRNNVSNFWYGIKSIENTKSFGLSNIDTHMMKNSEWGAVAYLSQSKYGKYGNSDYEGAYKEIYQNKSDGFKTGSSNGTPSTDESNKRDPQCDYDDMTDLGGDKGFCGPGASTTGNIYGIYDMSGGSSEYVMGVFGTSSEEIYSGSSTTNNSGFNGLISNDSPVTNSAKIPESIYYKIYTNSNSNAACNSEICYGDALSEVKNWYKDYAQIVNTTAPWFLRGGSYSSVYYAGVFNFSSQDGAAHAYNSTRIILINK